MSTDRRRINEIHTMEYDSPLKRKEILSHAAKWMNLEDIMISEISQLQKDKYHRSPLLGGIKSNQTHRNRK